MNVKNSLAHVPGIKVGHAHDLDALTGVTVVLCEDGAVGGVDQRGGAPGTRETDLLRPMHLVEGSRRRADRRQRVRPRCGEWRDEVSRREGHRL